MKRLMCFFCCVFVFASALCGCTDSQNQQVSVTASEQANAFNTYYNFETDCQANVANPPADYYVTKSPDGYYILKDHYIFFADVEEGVATPLCSKPNCLHNNTYYNTECNSFVVTMGEDITYNNGYLYYLSVNDESDSGTSIKRLSADGSGTKSTVYSSEYSTDSWIMHRGYIYNAYREYLPESDYENTDKCRIVLEQVSLENPDSKAVIYDSQEYLEFASFNYLAAFDSFLYYSNQYYTEEGELKESLCCYDIKNQSTKEVALPEGDTNTYEFGINYIYPLGDKLIFKAGREIYRCDLNAENTEKVMTLEDEYHNIFTDGTYLFEDNFANYLNSELLSITKEDSRTLKVYDRDFSLLDTLSAGDFEAYFRFCDDKYFIAIDYDGNLSYFDKSRIGSINGGQWAENPIEIVS